MSLLFEYCQKGDFKQLKLLIEQKCDVTQVDENGRTLLHHCCDHETIDCAKLLLEDESIRNSLINIQDNEGLSALHLACLNGNLMMVKYLCEQHADVRLVDNELHSVIHWITVCGHVDLFDVLIRYQAPLHTADIYGAFPIHYASQICGNEDAIKGLTIMKKLIDNDVDVECLDKQNRTPFLWAASANAIDALRVLYKAGANPFHTDKDNLTALHCAATCGHVLCIRMLVELYDCPLESEDANQCTPLFYAITFEHSHACRLLLDLKANPNHTDNRGRTPSHCAALKGNIDCLKHLIEHNADIWKKNKHGDYPIHEAINAVSLIKVRNEKSDISKLQNNCLNFIRYIFQLYPMKIHIRNGESRTSLHLAASLGDIETCQVLIDCGARINSFIKTTAGNFLTPYDLAHIRHQNICAEYLLYNYGGQRGNLLANIFARRIQKFFRQSKTKKSLIESENYKNLTQPINKKRLAMKSTKDSLLNQANLCLHNKILEDRFKDIKLSATKTERFSTNSPKEEKLSAQQRRNLFAESKRTKTSMNRSDDYDPNASTTRVIVHPSTSLAASVKLYERHKLIAEELYKLREARIHNNDIVINRELYKILIENAFNPQSRCIDEIEEYLESLMKAYDTELAAIRKRTKSVPSRRVHNCSQRKTKN